MSMIQIRLFPEGDRLGPDFQGGVPGLASETMAVVHDHNSRILVSGGSRENLVSVHFPDYDLDGGIDVRLRRIEIRGNRQALESLMPSLKHLEMIDTVKVRLSDGSDQAEPTPFVRVRHEKKKTQEHVRRLRRAERKASERAARGETVLKQPMRIEDRLEAKKRMQRRREPGVQPIFLKVRSRSTGQHFSLWIGKGPADGNRPKIGSYGLMANAP